MTDNVNCCVEGVLCCSLDCVKCVRACKRMSIELSTVFHSMCLSVHKRAGEIESFIAAVALISFAFIK